MNLTLTFDDAAAATLPINSDFGSGTFRPGLDEYGDDFGAPVPRPYDPNFNNFLGQQPDGTYSLFVGDFVALDGGSIQSWSITLEGITPVPEPAALLAGPAALLAVPGLVRRLRRGRAGGGTATIPVCSPVWSRRSAP
jgi:hypothetical protein